MQQSELLHQHATGGGPTLALPGAGPANQRQHGLREVDGAEFVPQKEKAHDDDLRGLPEAGRRRRQQLRVRRRGDHPLADGRQALGAKVPRGRCLPLHRPRVLHVLDRRSPADPQLGGAPGGRLHRGASGRLDQQQLRLRDLRGANE